MALNAAQWLLVTLISSGLLVVGFALASWLGASRSTRGRRPPDLPEPTQNSLDPSVTAALARLEADQAALFSTLEKLTMTVKRLSSRAGMQDLRAERASSTSEPPEGTSKAELLRHYGMSGKVGPDFAREQLRRERGSN